MIDMVKQVCNKKDPLVERRIYMQSESDPKISTEILENEMVGVREGVGRANEEGPRETGNARTEKRTKRSRELGKWSACALR